MCAHCGLTGNPPPFLKSLGAVFDLHFLHLCQCFRADKMLDVFKLTSSWRKRIPLGAASLAVNLTRPQGFLSYFHAPTIKQNQRSASYNP